MSLYRNIGIWGSEPRLETCVVLSQMSTSLDEFMDADDNSFYGEEEGVLNKFETGHVHHLLPPSRQGCEVENIPKEEHSMFYVESLGRNISPSCLVWCKYFVQSKTCTERSIQILY